MSNTFRKDRWNNYKKVPDGKQRYNCKCQRCVGKNSTIDKIAEKELKQQINEIN